MEEQKKENTENKELKEKPDVINSKKPEPPKEKRSFKEKIKQFHGKYYKQILIIPLALLILSSIFLFSFYKSNGDFFKKDISLTGGTAVTLIGNFDSATLNTDLSPQLEDLATRDIYDIVTKEQKAVVLETKTSPEETKQVLEQYLGYELTDETSSVEFTGSALSESFFKQLVLAILFAFILMAIVVFIIFRSFIPSFAIVLSAFADIFMTLALADALGMKLSSAGIVAFLMLIGYSVDTDILLTNRLLKSREGDINSRLYSAFKTGTTMTLTSLVAIGAALFIVKSFSLVLTQIFTIIFIGLLFDLLNTWLTNASILRWYIESKEARKQ